MKYDFSQTSLFEDNKPLQKEINKYETKKAGKGYDDFVKKFEHKFTTDDCYTPEAVYNAVAEWAEGEYGIDRAHFVRPFYPGGDYQNFPYDKADIVVDNPPFSIISEIARFYMDRQIKFFLFAPALTLFSCSASYATAICTGVSITYENGAEVNTSFLTNLEPSDVVARSAPELTEKIKNANISQKKSVPKYKYPDCIVTAAMISKFSLSGTEYKLLRNECERISALESQKKCGKGIFGHGFILSEKAAAQKAEAELEAEKAKAEAAAEIAAAEKLIVWELSEREKEIIKRIGTIPDIVVDHQINIYEAAGGSK